MHIIFVFAFLTVGKKFDPVVIWMFIGWAAGVVIHGLVAFETVNLFGVKWKKIKLKKNWVESHKNQYKKNTKM